MKSKRDNQGGHTSWSVTWEACLYARLHDGENLYISLSRIITRFLTPNLLSLHPVLERKEPQNCGTCFQEVNNMQIEQITAQREKQHNDAVLQSLLTHNSESNKHKNSVKNKIVIDTNTTKEQLFALYIDSLIDSLNSDNTDTASLNVNRGLITQEDAKVTILLLHLLCVLCEY